MKKFNKLLIAALTGFSLMLPTTLSASVAEKESAGFDRHVPSSGTSDVSMPANRTLNSHKFTFAPKGNRTKLRALPLSVNATDGRTSVICGSLLDQEAPGVYSWNLADKSLTPLLVSDELFANCNGFVYDNVYYSFFLEMWGSQPWITVYKYDVNTWERVGSTYIYYADTPMDLDVDPISNRVYGCFPKSNSLSEAAFVWAQYNPSTCVRMAICEYDTPMVAVACDATGQFYGIDSNADLYKINKLSGEKTLVGATGLTLSEQRQSAAFDHRYGHLYLAAELSDFETGVYEIDTTTGRATLLHHFPDGELLAGIYVPAPKAEYGAPAAITDLAVDFPQGSLSGNMTFTMPATTYGGQTLSGALTYIVSIDGTKAKEGTANAGSDVTVPLETTNGFHRFEAFASNAAGEAPVAAVNAFVGVDVPVSVGNLTAAKNDDGSITVAWSAPEGSVNGGWFDPAALKYRVVRFPDNKVIAEATSELSVTDKPDDGPFSSWQYEVTTLCGENKCESALSDFVVTGSYIGVPWTSDFTDDAMFKQFTIINVHNDYTWDHYDADNWKLGAYCDYDFSNPKDDWLITPPISLTGSHTYKIEFKTNTKRALPETLEVRWGSAPTVEGLDKELLAPTTFTSEDYSSTDILIVHEYYVSPSADGMYYVGFHAMSEAQMGALIIEYIKIIDVGENSVPEAPVNMSAVPGADGALEATVTLEAPATNRAGDALDAIDKIDFFVNGELAATVENPAPGSKVTATVATQQGNNEISAKAYNSFGAGPEVKTTVYTGVVVPGIVTDVYAKLEDNKIHLTWKAPQRGEDGGYINPAALTYMIMRNDNVILAYDHQGEEFIDDLQGFSVNGQRIVSYAVYARNAAGTGYGIYSNGCVLGDGFYKLPFFESFPGSQNTTEPWGIISTTETGWFITRDGTEVKAYDGDKGQAMFVPRGPGEWSMIYTGRFNLSRTVNPVFSLMYWNDGVSSNKVEFLWTDNYVDFHKLDGFSFNTPDKEKGWQEFKVSLASLIDKPFVSFGIKGIAGESGWEHNQYIDYFRVYDDLDHDLEMIEFDCPANVSFGMEGTFAGYIINRGSKEASGYTIDIYANNEVVASIPGSKVKTNETFVYTT